MKTHIENRSVFFVVLLLIYACAFHWVDATFQLDQIRRGKNFA